MTETIEQIREKLPEYLSVFGIDTTKGAFRCPIPDCMHKNADRNPSAQLHSDNKTVHCHTSGITWNIFDFAQFYEGLPKARDERFYLETIPHLAGKLGVPYTPVVLTEEQRKRYDYYRAYGDAAWYTGSKVSKLENYLNTRGRTADEVELFGIGTIEDRDSYIEFLIRKGWTREFLEECGLTQSNLFVPGSVMIPIRNNNGKIVGFVARHNEGVKYTNTRETDYYNKSKILFNFDKAKSEPGTLWIVEGYMDVVSLYLSGIKKVVALGGTALTAEHVELMKENRCSEILLCLDGDDRGLNATKRALDILSKNSAFKLRVMEIPDGMDPDDIIREKGVDVLKGLMTRTAFEYRLHREYPTPSIEDVQQNIIPIIAAEESPIMRDFMLNAVYTHTGLDLDVLKRELSFQIDRVEERGRQKEQMLVSQALRELQNPTADPLLVIDRLGSDLKQHRSGRLMIDPDIMKIEVLESLEKEWRENKPGIAGYRIPRFPRFSKIFDGYPRGSCIITIGALAGHGKSTLVRNLLWDMAQNNNDVQCLYMSIDDNSKTVNKSLIIMNSGVEVGEVRKFSALSADKRKKWEEAFIKVRNQDNFSILDSTVGRSIYSMTRYIDMYIEKFPMRKPIVAIDNFHILDGIHDQEIRMKTLENAKTLKYISTSYNIPILLVVQLNKVLSGYRPTPRDIQETVQIEYESDVLAILHSDLQHSAESHLYWKYINKDGSEIKMPFMETFVWKNKYDEFKSTSMEDTIWCKLNRSTSMLEELDYTDVPRKRRRNVSAGLEEEDF